MDLRRELQKKLHFKFIEKYNECWVPDYKVNGLAGELSHPKILPRRIKYIGALSRFEPDISEKKHDLLISISGPEPQRTIFEKQLLNQLLSYTGKVLFIRGLPESSEQFAFENSLIEFRNHLPAKELNKAMLQSGMVISRCGYTTIMDLVKLNKKAILIPTPGQTEQEYLANHLMEKKMFYTVTQKHFNLHHSLEQANSFPFDIPTHNMELYKEVIRQFVQSL